MTAVMITATELRRQFNEIIERVEKGETFIISRYGKPVAVMMPYEEYLGIDEVLNRLPEVNGGRNG